MPRPERPPRTDNRPAAVRDRVQRAADLQVEIEALRAASRDKTRGGARKAKPTRGRRGNP